MSTSATPHLTNDQFDAVLGSDRGHTSVGLARLSLRAEPGGSMLSKDKAGQPGVEVYVAYAAIWEQFAADLARLEKDGWTVLVGHFCDGACATKRFPSPQTAIEAARALVSPGRLTTLRFDPEGESGPQFIDLKQ